MIAVERVVELRRDGMSWRAIATQLGVSHVAVRKAARKAGLPLVTTADAPEDVRAGGNRLPGQRSPVLVDPTEPAEPSRSRVQTVPGARSWSEGVSLRSAYPCDSCGRTIAVGERHAIRLDGKRPRSRRCADCDDGRVVLLLGWPVSKVAS